MSNCAKSGRRGLRSASTWKSFFRHVDENTIGVVPTFGVTAIGHYEPVAQIAATLDDLAMRTGLDIAIRVDSASGEFVAPFVRLDLH
jgi:glutamate decarboxylase